MTAFGIHHSAGIIDETMPSALKASSMPTEEILEEIVEEVPEVTEEETDESAEEIPEEITEEVPEVTEEDTVEFEGIADEADEMIKDETDVQEASDNNPFPELDKHSFRWM